MRIEKLMRKISIWYQMAGQKVQKLKLNIFHYTFGTLATWTHSEGFAESDPAAVA